MRHGEWGAKQPQAYQERDTSELRPRYDFIVCGAGMSGSVIAGWPTQNPEVTVLLIQAGGSDDVPSVIDAI
jgi:choline dehydrogenase